MAVVDSRYRFVLIDVGGEGRQSDSGVFNASPIGHHLESGTLDTPGLKKLPGSDLVTPHVFIGDEAFQLRPDFLRPYPGLGLPTEKRVFNLRLSRTRNCVENAFGILCARWRILLMTINLIPENADGVVKAACVLHNFLSTHNNDSVGYGDNQDVFSNITEGRWHQELEGCSMLPSLHRTHARNFSRDAAASREAFTKYFCSPAGELSWQWARLHSTYYYLLPAHFFIPVENVQQFNSQTMQILTSAASRTFCNYVSEAVMFVGPLLQLLINETQFSIKPFMVV
ncbi:uncharacterized protein LOC135378400 [Ornithodoros turicata]|uniref:uncharacterized protein LOC135378400 n=1 Tax=Ornithodoros turicata TaxID=34597 RepID=UPI00313A3BCF